jgi:uncharacterized protein (UPF0212 family)
MAGTRHCPECGEEYVSTAMQCVECRVPLVSGEFRGIAPAAELPPIAQLVCLRAATLAFARGLSEQLAHAGISHRIEAAHDEGEEVALRRPGANMPYGVYVRSEDLEAAVEVDREYMRQAIPDLEAVGQQATGEEGCPACGAPLDPDAAECADCGLALVADA